MKAVLILVAAFGIQLSTLNAGTIGDMVTSSEPGNLFCPECLILTPTVPMEATFNEAIEFASPMNPTIPMNADFNEDLALLTEQRSNLSPVVPSTAEFSDSL